MNKSYLKQMLIYFSKIYHLGEKINTLKDKRAKSSVKISTVTFVVLFGFMLQIRSFNRLEHWLKKGKFKKVLPKKTKIPRIDTIRRVLSNFDLDGLNELNNSIIKTSTKNKVFRKGTIDGLKVVAIDGVELFESTNKCCDNCLTRVQKDGITHYFHRSVICATVGSDPHLIIGQEMLEPKRDASDKDEGEITAGKRLIRKLHKEFHHFADIIVADALYCKSTWIKEVLSIGMDAVVRVKDERLNIVKDALGLFKCREADKEWTVKKKSNNYIKIKAWDEDNFQMPNSDIEVRFIKFIEEIHSSSKVEIKESWIITTSKVTSVETLWKIIHKRWEIENNAFHQLKTEWHLNHCFLHSHEGVETVLMFIIIAFNLMQLYFFRCIRNFREKHMLQIDIIEDIKDEIFIIETGWSNPLFVKT
ncbi:transposase [Desulfotomaculum copahuensis]|uniref:Transposase n=1 Tax=Desulfotomaculum copahuensis TaxID=1838280 RepID=A0A1B7LFZ7_9FIRM|nr:transposase [Desulfotomaculum copahuensis]OAT83470.1 transposase [Desulfotomaculum copahuensis]